MYCPICNTISEKPSKCGDSPRFIMCPNCGSRERHRLVWLVLKNKFANLLGNNKVRCLHIASEKCLSQLLTQFYGSNYIYGALNLPGKHCIDLTNMSFSSNYFDLIICNHVLEHIVNDKAAMNEMYRVCAPNGAVLITVPILTAVTIEGKPDDSAVTRQEKFGDPNHVRMYGLDICDRLVGAGFDISLIYAKDIISLEQYNEMLLSDEPVIVCRKWGSV